MSTETASTETEEFIPNPEVELMEEDYPVKTPVLDDFFHTPKVKEESAKLSYMAQLLTRYIVNFTVAKSNAEYRKRQIQSVMRNYMLPFNFEEPDTVWMDKQGKMTHLFIPEKRHDHHVTMRQLLQHKTSIAPIVHESEF